MARFRADTRRPLLAADSAEDAENAFAQFESDQGNVEITQSAEYARHNSGASA